MLKGSSSFLRLITQLLFLRVPSGVGIRRRAEGKAGRNNVDLHIYLGSAVHVQCGKVRAEWQCAAVCVILNVAFCLLFVFICTKATS